MLHVNEDTTATAPHTHSFLQTHAPAHTHTHRYTDTQAFMHPHTHSDHGISAADMRSFILKVSSEYFEFLLTQNKMA